MRKIVIGAVIVGVALAGVLYYKSSRSGSATEAAGPGAEGGGGFAGRRGGGGGDFGGGGGRGGFGGGGGFRGGGGGGGFGGRGPMVVELASARRAAMNQEVRVVGNLIGEATVAVAPRTGGRLQDVFVRLGDRVSRGQRIAKIEDFEIVEQVKQAEAAQEVAAATIRQREADLQLALTNVERSRNLFQRQLLPKQTLDDNEARYQSAIAQIDLAKAQSMQSKARLDELRINLANTVIVSPVNGFVAKRSVDPGAFVSTNSPMVDVVDISRVRLVVNVVERDLKDLHAGAAAKVEVDAFPGELFQGRIARVAPVLDPATRTAPIEIEIPNADFRLKPGMYARVGITTETRKDALVVPVDAVADLGGRRGVFQHVNGLAIFRTVELGTEGEEFIEVVGGLTEGDQVITTGARALRDGDRVQLADGEEGRRGNGGRGRGDGTAPAARDGGGRSNATPGTTGGREGNEAAGQRSGGNGSGRRYGGDGSGRRSGGDGSGRYGNGSGRPGGDGTQRPANGQRPGNGGSSQ
jgi:membrane fusion protein, multidrug efflux system